MKKYIVRAWIPVMDIEDEECFENTDEAQRELEHLEGLFPENIYRIIEVDDDGEIITN